MSADAIPTTEQDVLATNQDMPDADQVVAAYDPALQGRTLDFPLVALSPPDAGHAEVVDRAADVLRQALLDRRHSSCSPRPGSATRVAGSPSRSGRCKVS